MAKPDYTLRAKIKNAEGPSKKVGAAWITKDGWISIKLDPFSEFSWRDNLLLTLFPAGERPKPTTPKGPDDDIPY